MYRRPISFLSRLEPFGLLTLAGGLLYSIGTLTFQVHDCRFHFLVLTLVIFVALVSLVAFKYIKYRTTWEHMHLMMSTMEKIQ